jgi:hypothetical protein
MNRVVVLIFVGVFVLIFVGVVVLRSCVLTSMRPSTGLDLLCPSCFSILFHGTRNILVQAAGSCALVLRGG